MVFLLTVLVHVVLAFAGNPGHVLFRYSDFAFLTFLISGIIQEPSKNGLVGE
jgi:hypothetical protein